MDNFNRRGLLSGLFSLPLLAKYKSFNATTHLKPVLGELLLCEQSRLLGVLHNLKLISKVNINNDKNVNLDVLYFDPRGIFVDASV